MRRMMMNLGLGLVVAITAMASASAADGPANGRGAGGPPWAREGNGPRPFMLFRIFDANEDDALSEEEVPGPVWARLSAADADEDGTVTRDELVAHLSARFRQARGTGERPTK